MLLLPCRLIFRHDRGRQYRYVQAMCSTGGQFLPVCISGACIGNNVPTWLLLSRGNFRQSALGVHGRARCVLHNGLVASGPLPGGLFLSGRSY